MLCGAPLPALPPPTPSTPDPLQVSIFVPVPKGLRARDLAIEYTSTHLKFGIKGRDPIVNADLPKRVKTSECMWSLGAFAYALGGCGSVSRRPNPALAELARR